MDSTSIFLSVYISAFPFYLWLPCLTLEYTNVELHQGRLMYIFLCGFCGYIFETTEDGGGVALNEICISIFIFDFWIGLSSAIK